MLYCVLKSKNSKDSVVDVMVRAEDASKINRIFEKFEMATVDMGTIEQDLERGVAKTGEGELQTHQSVKQELRSIREKQGKNAARGPQQSKTPTNRTPKPKAPKGKGR